ncbi:MAG: F0F1 ATP synthase subunit A [Anaerolineaceae bacterium]|nr:F0F1 ATP synthase subunit A [Anaerolineaceae bacterium]
MTTNQRGLVVLFGLLIFAAIVCVATPFVWLPGSGLAAGIPVIQVPGEILIHHWQPLNIDLGADFNLINTMVALIITDIIVVAIALWGFFISSRRWTKEVPGRFQSVLELIVGGLFSFVKNTAGSKNARSIYPLVATIFFFLLIGNWMSVIPGVESIGKFHCAHPNTNGYPAAQIGDDLYRLDNTQPLFGGDPVTLADEEACVAATGLGEGEHAAAATEGEHAAEVEGDPLQTYRFHITPFVRPAATDLNLTIGLALISFFFIQYYGFKEQGLNYLQKFIPVHSLGNISKQPLGAIDLIVGPLEFISELSKIVSLSFRLFGNIFAGGILIAVMLFLVGTGLPVIFYALELIVGLAQALVFAVLTLVFIAQAMEGHHGDEESH